MFKLGSKHSFTLLTGVQMVKTNLVIIGIKIMYL